MSTRLVLAEDAKLNVFEFDESRTYSYQILSLGTGHAGMTLRVYDDFGRYNEACSLHFLHVLYVDAPTRWTGGIFRSATHSECNKLRDILGMYRPKDDPNPLLGYSVDDCALFEAVTSSGKFVRILASVGVIVYNSWKDIVYDSDQKLIERITLTEDNIPVLRYLDSRGVEREIEVVHLLRLLAAEHPVESAYVVKPDDIQAVLLFASQLIDEKYGKDS